MTTILLLALLAAVVFYFYHKTGSGKNNIQEISNTSVDRVIRVYDMDKEQLEKAIDSFSDISENEGITSITPKATTNSASPSTHLWTTSECATGSISSPTPTRANNVASLSAAGTPSARYN